MKNYVPFYWTTPGATFLTEYSYILCYAIVIQLKRFWPFFIHVPRINLETVLLDIENKHSEWRWTPDVCEICGNFERIARVLGVQCGSQQYTVSFLNNESMVQRLMTDSRGLLSTFVDTWIYYLIISYTSS